MSTELQSPLSELESNLKKIHVDFQNEIKKSKAIDSEFITSKAMLVTKTQLTDLIKNLIQLTPEQIKAYIMFKISGLLNHYPQID